MKNRYTTILGRMVFMLLIPLVTKIHFYLNTYRPGTRELHTAFDDFFTFEPVFVIFYLYWFVYVFIVLSYFAIKDGKVYYKLLAAIVIGMLTSEVIFICYPTTVPRPSVEGSGVIMSLVRFVYNRDNPFNCFPSIHVLNSMLVTVYYCKYGQGKILKVTSIISFILIALSTLYLKQHYILDVIAAAILTLGMFKICESKVIIREGIVSKLRLMKR